MFDYTVSGDVVIEIFCVKDKDSSLPRSLSLSVSPATSGTSCLIPVYI